MAQSCLRIVRCQNLSHRFHRRILILRRFVRLLWNGILACSPRKSRRYRLLYPNATPSPSTSQPLAAASSTATATTTTTTADGVFSRDAPPVYRRDAASHRKSDSDLVPLKISLLGDRQIGKTSFLAKYGGNEREVGEQIQEKGLNLMDKTLSVGGARISYSIWEVEDIGDEKSCDQIPMACKDSVAILFMFDLTSRCTLNSVISWYQQARKWNQTAIPVLVGTKFDEFIQLPIDLQWTIASQARAYAKALNATLFFSSATYNINVNKIFKFVTARLFDLPWTVERNLTVGEPIIDY